MKWLRNMTICLAGGVVLNASLRADDLAMANADLSGNPYSIIAARNVFGIVPPPPPPDPVKEEEKNLPKITLTGIQSFFGAWQVLFKVPPGPGPQGKEQFYILNEGERQDDIEVVKIDVENSVVTFDNHGHQQEIALADAKGSGGGNAFPAYHSSNFGGRPSSFPAAGNGGSDITRFGGQAGERNNNTDGTQGINGDGGNPDGMNLGATSLQDRVYHAPIEGSGMSKQETELWIETQRAAAESLPASQRPYPPNILPPTSLSKYNTGNGN